MGLRWINMGNISLLAVLFFFYTHNLIILIKLCWITEHLPATLKSISSDFSCALPVRFGCKALNKKLPLALTAVSITSLWNAMPPTVMCRYNSAGVQQEKKRKNNSRDFSIHCWNKLHLVWQTIWHQNLWYVVFQAFTKEVKWWKYMEILYFSTNLSLFW